MDYKEPKLYYSTGNGKIGVQVPCCITNYKPPVPILNRKGNKVLLGYTHFQEKLKSDTAVRFTAAFDINSKKDQEDFKTFRKRYNEIFYFQDEMETLYKGVFQNSYDVETPIEGDIYYVSLEMVCPHDINGYVEGEEDGF